MSNSFVNFLSEAAYASGDLRDYQHASRLYVNNNYELAPKMGWLYYVVVNINPGLAAAITNPTAQAPSPSPSPSPSLSPSPSPASSPSPSPSLSDATFVNKIAIDCVVGGLAQGLAEFQVC